MNKVVLVQMALIFLNAIIIIFNPVALFVVDVVVDVVDVVVFLGADFIYRAKEFARSNQDASSPFCSGGCHYCWRNSCHYFMFAAMSGLPAGSYAVHPIALPDIAQKSVEVQ